MPGGSEREVLRHVGEGARGGCGFGTADGPCPNPPVTTVAAAAAHPTDGRARWLAAAWTPVCVWHRDALTLLVREGDVGALWAQRDAAPVTAVPVIEHARRGTVRWLEANPDGVFYAHLGL